MKNFHQVNSILTWPGSRNRTFPTRCLPPSSSPTEPPELITILTALPQSREVLPVLIFVWIESYSICSFVSGFFDSTAVVLSVAKLQITFYCIKLLQCIYPFSCWCTLGFPFWSYSNSIALNIFYTYLVYILELMYVFLLDIYPVM